MRWIETQDLLFTLYKFERFIEIGPSPTLTGMATRTLMAKYEDRGYDFHKRWWEDENLGCLGNHDHAICPTIVRSFGDVHCLYGKFGEDESEAGFGYSPELRASDWEVEWQFGGWHGCKGPRVSPTVRCWNTVTGQSDDPDNWNDPEGWDDVELHTN